MNTAVTPNSRKIRPLKEKYGKKYGNICDFCGFLTFFVIFWRFWGPGGPGTLPKASWRWYDEFPPNMSPWRATRLQNLWILMFLDPTFFRPTNIFRRNRSHMPPQAKPLGGNWPQMDSLVMSFSSKSLILMHIYNVSCHFSWKSTFSFRAFPSHFTKEFVSLLGF